MLLINILFISLPSIKKYLEKGIVIEVSTESLEDLPSPAFTISRIGADGRYVYLETMLLLDSVLFEYVQLLISSGASIKMALKNIRN